MMYPEKNESSQIQNGRLSAIIYINMSDIWQPCQIARPLMFLSY